MKILGTEAKSAVGFGLSWLLLDAMLNLRWPGDEPSLYWLLPSIDVLLLFVGLAWAASAGRKSPTWLRWVLVAGFFLVRLFRLGDGVQEAYYAQAFNIYTDLPMLPELVRFAVSTHPAWQIAIIGLVIFGGAALLAFALYRALSRAESYLADTKHLLPVAGVAAAFSLGSLVVGHAPSKDHFFMGGFAASAFPRLKREALLLVNVYSTRASFAANIAATEKTLAASGGNLSKLGRSSVYLFVVESYGETVFRKPEFVSSTRAFYTDLERDLGGSGFEMASALLDSSTYGGRSWLAQATLATGVRTSNQLEYDILCAKQPKGIAKFFQAAGYRAVLAQPGTTRPWPKGEFFGFDRRYYAWNFEYRGPEFEWATMPDQYVVDYVRRRELGSERTQPLFIEYVLVSSHAPWSVQPTLVDDWKRLENGQIFGRLEPQRYPVSWPKFANGSGPYIRSIEYDLQ
ncbi:MAG TPA: hypothetical protein VGL19_07655, partial [Polyangiaceae bacterium]